MAGPTGRHRRRQQTRLAGTDFRPPSQTAPDGQGGIIRDPFLNNALPQDRLSSISVFLQEAGYPRANQPGLQNNWAGLSIPRTLDREPIFGQDRQRGLGQPPAELRFRSDARQRPDWRHVDTRDLANRQPQPARRAMALPPGG